MSNVPANAGSRWLVVGGWLSVAASLHIGCIAAGRGEMAASTRRSPQDPPPPVRRRHATLDRLSISGSIARGI
ncbi:MAG: hypothetical protein IPP23_03065 [Sphingomonadales bacterium]|nr:hypothetical protein [Sphingomonadales bacterium]